MTESHETPSLLRAVEDFLFHEAELMDRHAYDSWLELWDEDATYWVPCNEEDVDPRKQLSLIFEHREQIEDRLYRLKGRHAHAQSPKSRIARVISNIRLREVEADRLKVTSQFVLGDVRLERQTVLFGRTEHVLLSRNNRFSIRQKKVFLINNDTPMANVTFLL